MKASKPCVVLFALALLPLCCECSTALTVPAWRNMVEKSAALRVVEAYTSNVIRVEWAGSRAKLTSRYPASPSFQFAVVGDADVTNRVAQTLAATRDALPAITRDHVMKLNFLIPTLQWIVRSVRAQKLGHGFFDIRTHPAVFVECDFERKRLVSFASELMPGEIPPCAMAGLSYGVGRLPILRPEPGADYPDLMEEETFATPFGGAYVLRAPESVRKIRVYAATYPFTVRDVQFVWSTPFCRSKTGWSYDSRLTFTKGYAELVLEVGRLASGDRIDIGVFPKFSNGIYGLPAIISFYKPPAAVWKLDEKGRTSKITYFSDEKHEAPYDISPIWIPRCWEDSYVWDESGLLSSISRKIKGDFRYGEYARFNERVVSTYSSGSPRETLAVRYVVDAKTGCLMDEEVPNGVKEYKIGEFKPRRRGE